MILGCDEPNTLAHAMKPQGTFEYNLQSSLALPHCSSSDCNIVSPPKYLEKYLPVDQTRYVLDIHYMTILAIHILDLSVNTGSLVIVA